ncbi:MAG: acetyl-CoA carboxylase biotin carboxylase subunit [Holosporales bacterium]|jgi:acetyl-CoA carboxylase biotin carboxylase subunit|nr:acetyl-CoA carboxylase biotin carboxylase subunit [Holosporales bacterium]
MKLFSKILIANRGEIALRILRACQELGIKTVVVHSTADEDSMPVRIADESVCIGEPLAKDSYLNMRAIMTAAEITGAEAIHPGVGFLSENARFARMVTEHGRTFIGPSPEHIELMGDKITAKNTMQKFGIPTIPGSNGEIADEDTALQQAEAIGLPVLIKATAGGGGKGMKVACNEQDVVQAYRLAKAESKSSFANDRVYMERYLKTPRHIEFQILADQHGHVVSLGERDCSIQRNHQKIWEEAPATNIPASVLSRMSELIVKAIKKLRYVGVGTVEMLYEDEQFYFMEMNTRLQVEHTVTEMVTGIDLVKEQILVAAGNPLSFAQKDVCIRGHSIECRINAEDPKTFFPCPGKVNMFHAANGFGIRTDSHVYCGYTIPPYYDSLIGKLITHANTRDECLSKMRRALNELVIDGVATIVPLQQQLADHPAVIEGGVDIHWLERTLDSLSR